MAPPVEGRILTHTMPDTHGNVATLQAIGNNLAENELLPRLYHARLISIADAEPAGGKRLRAAGNPPTPEALRRSLRVLVVDDDQDTADLFADLLEIDGHNVKALYCGDALRETAVWFKPDVTFLDLFMPKTDGYEAALELRSDPALANVWMVAVTGFADPASITRVRNGVRRLLSQADRAGHTRRNPCPVLFTAALAS